MNETGQLLISNKHNVNRNERRRVHKTKRTKRINKQNIRSNKEVRMIDEHIFNGEEVALKHKIIGLEELTKSINRLSDILQRRK